MVRTRLVIIACLCLLMPAHAGEVAVGGDLPASLREVLARHRIPPQAVSLYAIEVGRSQPLLSFNAEVARNPASTMKLLATLAALEELGPAYTWKTEAFAHGRLSNGVLQGDLYLKGHADPYLVTESFWNLLRGLRQRGLQDIRGDLVLDGSFVQPDQVDRASFDGKPARAYNANPDALLVNFQAIQFRLLPEPGAGRLRIVADPHPANIRIENRLRVVKGPCGGGNNRVTADIIRTEHDDRVRFSGRYAVACGDYSLYRVVSEGPRHVYGVFKQLWAEQGGRFEGKLREAAVPEDAVELHAVDSPPLADVVRSINKYSNNVMTRQLVLTLGAERDGVPGTTAKGLGAVRAWLAKRGLRFPELVLENGAGLSREERISAAHLGDVLMAGYTSEFMPEFMSSLPVAGIDGTLHRRYAGGELQGRVHAKTGSLNEVRSLAGYMLDRQGRRVVVVILHNGTTADARGAEALEDALLHWLYQRS